MSVLWVPTYCHWGRVRSDSVVIAVRTELVVTRLFVAELSGLCTWSAPYPDHGILC